MLLWNRRTTLKFLPTDNIGLAPFRIMEDILKFTAQAMMHLFREFYWVRMKVLQWEAGILLPGRMIRIMPGQLTGARTGDKRGWICKRTTGDKRTRETDGQFNRTDLL